MNAVEIEEAISQLAESPFDKDEFPYQFLEAFGNKSTTIKRLKRGSSENREYLPVGMIDKKSTATNLAFALYDAPLWNMALIASRIHLVWNTFPVPKICQKTSDKLMIETMKHFCPKCKWRRLHLSDRYGTRRRRI